MKPSRTRSVLLSLAALAFILWVWPTPYAHYRDSDGNNLRVHRLTGTTYVLTMHGWIRQ